MDLNLFSYLYPKNLVAQQPLAQRDASRMMVLDHKGQCPNQKKWRHDCFKNLPDYFQAGDLLVLNDTKVFPARLLGTDEQNRKVEILLLEPINDAHRWNCLGKPLKRLRNETNLSFSPQLNGRMFRQVPDRLTIQLVGELEEIERIGLPPLPPYIRRDITPEDKIRYQSIFAKNPGSAAAPTASFHFTNELLAEIKAKGVETAFITLHISRDTFLPIRTANATQHKMHGERLVVPQETRQKILAAKKEKRRVIAVGTTVVRALESDWSKGKTDLFITPGFQFKITDAILTNFHQPQSTLLLLVCAFAGREFILDAYQEAIAQQYRLFSYGDCMLIL